MSALRDGTRRPSERKYTLVVGGRDAMAALERAGHVVAPTVDVALEELATERFDRLLIDGSGPRGDERLEGADRLREASSAAPVVAFCADDDDARAAIDAGVSGVVRAALGSLSAEALEDELAAILGRRGADAGRHEAVADLGRRALEGTPSSALLERAVALVHDALSLERCGAFELVPEGRLLLREGVGWGPDAVGTLALDAEGSQAARSLTGEPAVGALDESGTGNDTLADGPGSGISVVVGSGEEPWGVLGAYASDRRTFDASDVGFVRSVANVVGGVVARGRTDRRTRIDGDLAERITETSPIGITVVGRDGRITFANERAEVIFGRSRAEMNALAYDDEGWEETAFAGEPLPPEELPFRRVMEAGEPISDHQSRVRRPDGSYAWLSINGAPLYEEGELAGVVFAIEDVTERHRFEVELEEVYGRVTDAFVALDANARVTHLNERAERLLGLPAERLIGTEIWEPFPDVFEETFRADYWEAMETQEPIERERYYPFLDRWYEGRAYPSESGLSVYFRDVTERKRTERRLREE
jgi:PAS domain S-box-containing protein